MSLHTCMPGLEECRAVQSVDTRCLQIGNGKSATVSQYTGVNESSDDGADMSENAQPMSFMPGRQMPELSSSSSGGKK